MWCEHCKSDGDAPCPFCHRNSDIEQPMTQIFKGQNRFTELLTINETYFLDDVAYQEDQFELEFEQDAKNLLDNKDLL